MKSVNQDKDSSNQKTYKKTKYGNKKNYQQGNSNTLTILTLSIKTPHHRSTQEYDQILAQQRHTLESGLH